MFASGRTGAGALVARLASRVSQPLTRFAPAPTGYLHLGHVVNALYVWGLARALGGRVLLRIEDHDRQRARREYEQALLDDLEWLGFEPDVYPYAGFRAGACEGRQSDRDRAYRDALEPLVAAGLVYGCDCTRKQLTEGPYPGTCRERGVPLRDSVGWRVRLDDATETFDDGLIGPQQQTPATQCGDVLIRDRLGNWTYQWAATTDDTRQSIGLIVRGHDLLDSTGRQIQLARLLGRDEPPVFVHHALVMKTATQKLSKSDGDTGVRDLRTGGWTAARVLGHAAALAGLQPAPDPIDAAAAATQFDGTRW
jgi:glutamyl-Q tRNA(Asp) synthetase